MTHCVSRSAIPITVFRKKFLTFPRKTRFILITLWNANRVTLGLTPLALASFALRTRTARAVLSSRSTMRLPSSLAQLIRPRGLARIIAPAARSVRALFVENILSIHHSCHLLLPPHFTFIYGRDTSAHLWASPPLAHRAHSDSIARATVKLSTAPTASSRLQTRLHARTFRPRPLATLASSSTRMERLASP